MYRKSTVGVVVPAYNEEGFVGDVLRELPEFVDRVYAIDDCSTDRTWAEITETATQLSKTDKTCKTSGEFYLPQVAETGRTPADLNVAPETVDLLDSRVQTYEWRGEYIAIQHTENFGAGGAIKTGYLAALADGVDVVVTIDADGQMDPQIMGRIVEPVVNGPVDYAKGTRFAGHGDRQQMPAIRTLGNVSLTYMTKLASGYWQMTDSQNGYTAISRSALNTIGIEDLFEYYAYCNAVLVRLNVHNIPIADVAVPTTYGDESSDIEYSTFILTVAPMLGRKFIWRLSKKYARRRWVSIALLYCVGLLLAVLWGTLTTVRRDQTPSRLRRKISFVLGSSTVCALAGAMGVEWMVSRDLVTVIEDGTYEASATARDNPASMSTE